VVLLEGPPADAADGVIDGLTVTLALALALALGDTVALGEVVPTAHGRALVLALALPLALALALGLALTVTDAVAAAAGPAESGPGPSSTRPSSDDGSITLNAEKPECASAADATDGPAVGLRRD
jgi:hypothetical protein